MEELPGGVETAAVDAMPVEVAILDAEGTIVVVNDAWRRFADENHGTHPDYWVGENYLDVLENAFEEPRESEVYGALTDVLAGTTDRFRLEYPCHSPDEQRWFIVDAAGFEFDGERHVLVSHANITDRKLAERRADARAEQLETVLGILAHDIRNPLQVIDGYADVLAEDLDDPKLDGIRQAATRIGEITEATLAFSRSGALESVESLSVSELAREAWATVPTGELTLTVRDAPRIHGDRRLLLQLFENLFRNAVEHGSTSPASERRQDAVEYTDSHGSVTVGGLPDGFYVEDEGPGIPPDLREKALRADFSTQGTGGLGLAIVQTVVTAHDGTLRITDAEGGGARFEITGLDTAPEQPDRSRASGT